MITSKKAVHRNSARKSIKIPATAEPRIMRKIARSRRCQSATVRDAMLHNWLLEKDDCGVDSG
jgi:hypothetical protein